MTRRAKTVRNYVIDAYIRHQMPIAVKHKILYKREWMAFSILFVHINAFDRGSYGI